MDHFKLIIGVAATLLGLASYVPYLAGTIKGTLRPNATSWLVWGVLAGVAFGGQIVSGAGLGALITGTSALASFVVMGLALRHKSSRRFSRLDLSCLIAGAVALVVWPIARSPLLSVALVSSITLVGYIPTYTKSWTRPYEENISMYLLGIVKYAMSVLVLGTYSATNVLYPAVVVLANTVLISLLVMRAKQLSMAPAGSIEMSAAEAPTVA
jgi:hypothetical protein